MHFFSDLQVFIVTIGVFQALLGIPLSRGGNFYEEYKSNNKRRNK
jgi:hypothetical protein